METTEEVSRHLRPMNVEGTGACEVPPGRCRNDNQDTGAVETTVKRAQQFRGTSGPYDEVPIVVVETRR